MENAQKLNQEPLMTPQDEKKRTLSQNNALHLYCEMLYQKLSFAGITQKKFLSIMDEIDNSPKSIKAVFREYGKAKYGKTSTADLTTKEMSDIYEEFNRNLSKIGVYVAWPSEDNKNFNQTYEKR